jgi:hypothetical protein
MDTTTRSVAKMRPEEMQKVCDDYKNQLDAATITKEEYTQTLLDLDFMQGIPEEDQTTELRETLTAILNTALAAA